MINWLNDWETESFRLQAFVCDVLHHCRSCKTLRQKNKLHTASQCLWVSDDAVGNCSCVAIGRHAIACCFEFSGPYPTLWRLLSVPEETLTLPHRDQPAKRRGCSLAQNSNHSSTDRDDEALSATNRHYGRTKVGAASCKTDTISSFIALQEPEDSLVTQRNLQVSQDCKTVFSRARQRSFSAR